MKDITHYFHIPDKECEVIAHSANENGESAFDRDSVKVTKKCDRVKVKNIAKSIQTAQEPGGNLFSKHLENNKCRQGKKTRKSGSYTTASCSGTEGNMHISIDQTDSETALESHINKRSKVILPITDTIHDSDSVRGTLIIDLESKENHFELKCENSNDSSCSEVVQKQSPNAFQVLMSMRSRQTFSSAHVWGTESEKEAVIVKDNISVEDEIIKKEVKRKRKKTLEAMAERRQAKRKKHMCKKDMSENTVIKKSRIMPTVVTDSETELFDRTVTINCRGKKRDTKILNSKPEKLSRKMKKHVDCRKRKIVQQIIESNSEDDANKISVVSRSVLKSLEKGKKNMGTYLTEKESHIKNKYKIKPQKNGNLIENDMVSSEEILLKISNQQEDRSDIKYSSQQDEFMQEVPHSTSLKEVITESLDLADEGKKKKNLLSYFNKVTSESAGRKSARIEVKAQVHFPSAVSTKASCVVRLRGKRTSAKLGAVDEITVVGSENIEQKTCVESSCERELVVSNQNCEGKQKWKLNQNSPSGSLYRTPSTQEMTAATLPSSCMAWKMRIRLVDTGLEANTSGHAGVVSLSDKKRVSRNGNTKNHRMKASAQHRVVRQVLKKAKTLRKAVASQEKRDEEVEVVHRTEVCQERKVETIQKSGAGKELRKAKLLSKSNHKMQEESTVVPTRRRGGLRNIKEVPQRTAQQKPAKTVPTTKLAPVFMKRRKHRKPDTATIMARRSFLESGVPDAVKKIVDLQRIVEEIQHAAFPLVSHVQQKDSSSFIWDLPNELSAFHLCEVGSPPAYRQSRLPTGTFTLVSVESKPKQPLPPRIKSFRRILHEIKLESADFPVYRTFRALRVKSGLAGQESSVLWTDKYQPTSVDEILGNGASVRRLQKWLEAWTSLSVDCRGSRKHQEAVSSGDEFVNSEDDGARTVPDNSVILLGPSGSGKTSALYAAANEIGCKVLELNASSKRTGKLVLAQLQEATQSHQVQSDQPAGQSGFFKSNTPSASNSPLSEEDEDDDQQSNKLSIILVEDADVVLEDQDEGFVAALSSLVAGSKRPVVLATSSPSCPHLARFLETCPVLEFCLPPQHLLSVWLQLVCLVEGVHVSRASMSRLLAYNRGDVRRTMLQLQLWVMTGGYDVSVLPVRHDLSAPDVGEDCSNLSWAAEEERNDGDEQNHLEPTCCVDPFLDPSQNHPFPFPVNLGTVWWNVAPLLVLPQVEHRPVQVTMKELQSRIHVNDSLQPCLSDNEKYFSSETSILGQDLDSSKPWTSACSMGDMAAVARVTDVLSFLDGGSCVAMLGEVASDSESYLRAWQSPPADGMSLKQDRCVRWYGALLTSQQLSHWLAESSVTQCARHLQADGQATDSVKRDFGLPSLDELTWRTVQHHAAAALSPAASLLYEVERRAMASDYTPALRAISRLEHGRCVTNTKRRNRFFHYLKGLGVHTNDTVFDTLCAVFR